TDTHEDRLRWWYSNDPVLQRHAVTMFDREERDLLAIVAGDPSHELHFESIDKLDGGDFEERLFQDLKIGALKHPLPKIRATAAKAILWDEPIAALDALLIAATDEELDVATSALDTLCWYPSQKCILTLVKLRAGCVEDERRSDFDHVIHELVDDFIR